jgi:RNA polymerase sigma-70 factor (ECF subfamily)
MAPEGELPDEDRPSQGSPIGAEDLALARRALGGAVDAKRELAQRLVCVSRMLAALNSRWGRPLGAHDLEDLTQDVLIAVWRGLPSFAGLSSLESWIFRSCHRALFARLHRDRQGRATGDSGALENLAHASPQVHDDVYRALEAIEPRARQVIELKHFDGLTFEEIGAKLSTSPNTIKSVYYRTIADLKLALSREWAGGKT